MIFDKWGKNENETQKLNPSFVFPLFHLRIFFPFLLKILINYLVSSKN